MTLLLPAVLAVPLLLLLLLTVPAARTATLRIAPWAPLPALLLALAAPVGLECEMEWLLLGTRLGLEAGVGQPILAATALVWLAGGLAARAWFAGRRQARFFAFFLATQMGNLGLCLALDPVGFYLFYALMGFAAYGLVVHEASVAAYRAGRIYLVLVVAGETLILVGLLLYSSDAASTPLLTAFCLLLGFGVKGGVPLLHFALPPAYGHTPIPAAATLAGAMINAGLLGWLRFLPPLEGALPGPGTLAVGLGLFAIFAGVAAGLLQRRPGTLLAYSSISQMGYLTLATGIGLANPVLWPALLPAMVLYAVHHGLAKGALFLGLGVIRRQRPGWTGVAGLALPALALAGAPLTSGMAAKGALQRALDLPELAWLPTLLSFASLATALLMIRLLWLAWGERGGNSERPATGLLSPWLLLLAAVAVVGWLLSPPGAFSAALQPTALAKALWPLLAALLLSRLTLALRRPMPELPPGDLLIPLERGIARLAEWLARRRLSHVPTPPAVGAALRFEQMEGVLRRWVVAGGIWIFLLLLFAFLVVAGRGV